MLGFLSSRRSATSKNAGTEDSIELITDDPKKCYWHNHSQGLNSIFYANKKLALLAYKYNAIEWEELQW